MLALGMQRGIARQESGIDGALAENGAEIIGEQECEQECIGHQSAAQDRSPSRYPGQNR